MVDVMKHMIDAEKHKLAKDIQVFYKGKEISCNVTKIEVVNLDCTESNAEFIFDFEDEECENTKPD